MTNEEVVSEKIEEGLFFPEDFKELPKGTVIFIKEGKLICPK